MSQRTEKLILLRLRAGDRDAYSDLYKQYAEPIYRFVYFRIGNERDAEDLMQEVFIRFIEVVDKEHITRISSYLYRIARNLITDHYRHIRRRENIDPSFLEGIQSMVGPRYIEAKADVELLAKSLYKLKPVWRDIIILRLVEGHDNKVVAAAIGKSVTYVRVNLHRALKELKKILESPHLLNQR